MKLTIGEAVDMAIKGNVAPLYQEMEKMVGCLEVIHIRANDHDVKLLASAVLDLTAIVADYIFKKENPQ
jgi:hypothetical protein